MIFGLCLELRRIMLGFFDKLQKFLREVSLLDNPIPKINAGSSREPAIEAAPMHANCDSAHEANGSSSKLLWRRHGVVSCFVFISL
jgi:hypothetical protein